MDDSCIATLEHIGLGYRRQGGVPWKRTLFWALNDVTFDLKKGDTLGIIGRNGAGKSSLLRVIAGIILPDRGELTRVPKARITLLSFGAGFESRLTGRQNIILNGLQLGMDKSYVLSRMELIVELADIGEFIDEPVRTYSTGMRARLGFAIAYYIETDVMLIDEALAAGDEAFREKATELIREKISSDLTVVIVSHSMALISSTCTRVIQIEHGVSLPEISPDETIERYRATTIV